MEPGSDMLLIGKPSTQEPGMEGRIVKRTADEVAQTRQQNHDLVAARLSLLAPVFAELGITKDHIHPQHSTGIILVSGLSEEINKTLRRKVEELGLLGGDEAKTIPATKTE